MLRLSLTIGASLALAAVSPVVASARPITSQHRAAYLRAYHETQQKFGRRAPGRNIVKDGTAHGGASDAQVVSSLAVLDRLLTPAPVAAPSYTQPTTTTSFTPTATSGGGGAGGVPACASESGTNYSTGPSNTNPSSGATGRYQILPSTSQAYGCSMATPAGQDQCAAKIYAAAGASQWVGCGG